MKGKIFDVKVLAIISVTAIALFVSTALLQEGVEADVSTYDGPLKAAIINQLHDDFPNEFFEQTAKKYLEVAGYEVDVFTTQDVTVDFFKNLPKMNYQFIVVRTHGATDLADSGSVVLFTGEKYTDEKYISEQLFGHVKSVTPLLERMYRIQSSDSSQWQIINDSYSVLTMPATSIDKADNKFFAISPKLVDEQMVGKFPNTTFILGGCNTMTNPSMAESLLKRGASLVIGWDDKVSSSDNDTAMLQLLQQMILNDMAIEDAIEKITEYFPPEQMSYPAKLKYFSTNNT